MFYQAYSADAILNIIPGICDIVANGCQHAHASDYYTSFTQFFNPVFILTLSFRHSVLANLILALHYCDTVQDHLWQKKKAALLH